MFNKYLTRKLVAKACVFVLNSTNCLNCTSVGQNVLSRPHVYLCVKHTSIVSFWWLPLARIAYFAGFVHEMSRGAAHAFLYGFTITGDCISYTVW